MQGRAAVQRDTSRIAGRFFFLKVTNGTCLRFPRIRRVLLVPGKAVVVSVLPAAIECKPASEPRVSPRARFLCLELSDKDFTTAASFVLHPPNLCLARGAGWRDGGPSGTAEVAQQADAATLACSGAVRERQAGGAKPRAPQPAAAPLPLQRRHRRREKAAKFSLHPKGGTAPPSRGSSRAARNAHHRAAPRHATRRGCRSASAPRRLARTPYTMPAVRPHGHGPCSPRAIQGAA